MSSTFRRIGGYETSNANNKTIASVNPSTGMAILVAIDGGYNSDNVAEVGYDLATTFDVDMYAVHVLTESTYEEQSEERSDYSMEDARKEAAAVAEQVVEGALGSPDNVKSVGRIGNPATEVLAFAEEMDTQYIVTGGRRRSPTSKAIFGSDSQQILLQSRFPVVTVMGPMNGSE